MVGKAEWLAIAAKADESFSGMTPRERRILMGTIHRDGGPTPENLQRMIRAWEYVVSRAKDAGVDVDAVVGSYGAIETLERIERFDPVEASRRARDVFLGRTSVREVAAVLAGYKKQRIETKAVGTPSRWRVYWEETANTVFGDRLVSLSIEAAGHSARGQWLRVDLEADLRQGRRAALFLSPKNIFSSFVRKPFMDQLPRVLTAMAYYDEVAYVAYSNEEKATIETMVGEGKWGRKRVDLYDPAPWDIDLDD